MKFLFIILVFLISVIAIAFWKDIKSMSARKPKRKKNEMETAKETANRNK